VVRGVRCQGAGLDALREIKSRHADTVVIMIAGNVLIENTISAQRGGQAGLVVRARRRG
jgi:DNA-binding NtrC family response regulator